MITMGFRAAPRCVTFAIYDSADEAIVNIEDIHVPAAFAWPEALKFVRNSILDVLREFGVEQAGVRTTEPIAKSPSIERMQIEGVIQEAFASSSLQKYFAGPINVGAAVLRVEKAALKPMIAGRNDMDIEGWDRMSEARREAVLYAMGAANA